MNILGISAFYHDSASCLVRDGEVVAAAQEERFTRKKHDASFPRNAVDYCLRQAGITAAELDLVAFYDKPLLKFERLLESHLARAPRGSGSFAAAVPSWIKQKLWMSDCIERETGYRKKVLYPSHHESHAASAFFPSPFSEAAVLTVDGVGEWATACWGVGRGNRIELSAAMRFPHSLGLLYSAFTDHLGFDVNADECKVMGLAPLGRPRFVDRILSELLDLREDGSFRLDMRYFDYCAGLTMTNRRFERLFEGPRRPPGSPLTQREMDLACSVQHATCEIMLRMAAHAGRHTGMRRLCLAGGVALNCVANGMIARKGSFDEIWIQPAAGDAGGALGAALCAWHGYLGNGRETDGASDGMKNAALGPGFGNEEIRAFLKERSVPFIELCESEIAPRTAALISQGKIVGWFQGRMEFGPRALGNRSILADARDPGMRDLLNKRVKFREPFRPFAPSVPLDDAAAWFEPGRPSPYMMLTANVRERSIDNGAICQAACPLPAVTHADLSARIHTVTQRGNALLYRTLKALGKLTGCPVALNTSFNIMGEPIVCTPGEAYRCFMKTRIDCLVMGNCLIEKQRTPIACAPCSGASGNEFFARGHALHDLLACPVCKEPLKADASGFGCGACGRTCPVDGGILRGLPNEKALGPVNRAVKEFYELNPFPGYEEIETAADLVRKASGGRFAAALNDQIPFGALVLEAGCGTGQLANYLGIAQRTVIGADVSLASLEPAERFRAANVIDNVRFVHMDLLHPVFRPGGFDVVICNGVIHHTQDPADAFRSVAGLVKKGGYLIVGVYNLFGRAAHGLRRCAFALSGGRTARWDPRLRSGRLDARRGAAWINDQYRNPRETAHTASQVLSWLDTAGFEYVNSMPSIGNEGYGSALADLFGRRPRPGLIGRTITQAAMLASGREGGLFIMIGRKPGGPGQGRAPVNRVVDAKATRSLRVFGTASAAAVCVAGIFFAVAGNPACWAAFTAGVALLACAVVRPRSLDAILRTARQVNRCLLRLLSPFMLAAVFFGVVTPLGIMLRLLGRRLLDLGPDRSKSTYWEQTTRAGPEASDYEHPF